MEKPWAEWFSDVTVAFQVDSQSPFAFGVQTLAQCSVATL